MWLVAGAGLAAWIHFAGLAAQLYLLAGGLFAYGLALVILSRSRGSNAYTQIMADLHGMPLAMRRLAVVQFFSWFALFAMWIYTTAAVTEVHFGSSDSTSAAYNEGANWVGVLFAAYNGFRRDRRDRDSLDGRAAGPALEPLDQSLDRRGRLAVLSFHRQSGLAARLDGRHRFRLGLDPVPTLCPALRQPAGEENGRVTWASSISSS